VTTPWLSIVIPTMGRPELARTFDSIAAQHDPSAVQVLVVGDTHGGHTPDLERARLQTLRRGYHWLEHDGGQHIVGQPQRQYGMQHAAGQWVAFSADDNIQTQGALAEIWQVVAGLPRPMPIVFRVRTWQAGVVWQRERKELLLGNIDADCLVVPNVPEKLGRWENVYVGDFEFAKQTIQLWDHQVCWADALIGLARPGEDELWWK
jgi:hypothetical protein